MLKKTENKLDNLNYETLRTFFGKATFFIMVGKPGSEDIEAVRTGRIVILARDSYPIEGKFKYTLYEKTLPASTNNCAEISADWLLKEIDAISSWGRADTRPLELTICEDIQAAQTVAFGLNTLRDALKEYQYTYHEQEYTVSVYRSGRGFADFINIRCITPESGYIQSEMAHIVSNEPKLHLSIREEHIEAGWNTLIPIFLQCNLRYFKVVRPGVRLSVSCSPDNSHRRQPDQCGKDITIYLSSNCSKSLSDWGAVIKRCVEALITNRIPSGYRVITLDRVVTAEDRPDTLFTHFPHYISFRFGKSQSTTISESDFLKSIQWTLDERTLVDFMDDEGMHSLVGRPWKDGDKLVMQNHEQSKKDTPKLSFVSRIRRTEPELVVKPARKSSLSGRVRTVIPTLMLPNSEQHSDKPLSLIEAQENAATEAYADEDTTSTELSTSSSSIESPRLSRQSK